MAIQFVDGSTDQSGPPWVLGEGAGFASGDFVVLMACTQNTAGTFSAPADFTLIHEVTETVGTDTRIGLWYKIRGADTGSGYSLNYSGASAASQALLAAYRGTSATPLELDVAFTTATHYSAVLNSASAASPNITTSASGCQILCLYAAPGGPIDTVGPPSGYNQRKAATGATNVYLADGSAGAAGVQTPGNYDMVEAVGGQDPRMWVLAIKEPAAAAANPKGPMGMPLRGPFGGPI